MRNTSASSARCSTSKVNAAGRTPAAARREGPEMTEQNAFETFAADTSRQIDALRAQLAERGQQTVRKQIEAIEAALPGHGVRFRDWMGAEIIDISPALSDADGFACDGISPGDIEKCVANFPQLAPVAPELTRIFEISGVMIDHESCLNEVCGPAWERAGPDAETCFDP